MSECGTFGPSAEQITAALRCCGNTDTKKPDCEHCPLLSRRMCVKVMLEGAADLIVRLNDFDKSQSKIMLERCQKAEAELAESQRRAQAEDALLSKIKVDWMNPEKWVGAISNWCGPQEAGKREAK